MCGIVADFCQATDDERQQWDDVKFGLESKLSEAEGLSGSLQLELEKIRSEQENAGHHDPELQAKFDDLSERHMRLQNGLREQEFVSEEVRRQASNFMQDMEAMSELAQANWEREEQLSEQVHRLEGEIEQWKHRYAKARAQLRHLRSSTVGLGDSLPDAAKANAFAQPDGLVKDVHITKFQVSIDELLGAARSDEPGRVLEQVKGIVLAVRHIMQDVEMDGNSTPSAMLANVKGRVPATANNLITASRNFANSSGLSPVSLLDAAASHLSTSVIELARLVKVRFTPESELEAEDDDSVQSVAYFNVSQSTQNGHNRNESVYSAISTPAAAQGNVTSHFPLPPKGVPTGEDVDAKTADLVDRDIEELKVSR